MGGGLECCGEVVLSTARKGKVTSFLMAVKKGADETVVLGWVSWPSKAVRDASLQARREDQRFAELGEMPFDGMRMMFAGFEVILDV